MDTHEIIREVKKISDAINKCAANAQADSLLQCYWNSEDFRAFSADGIMRNFQDFSKICKDYYVSITKQEQITHQEVFNVLENNIVILSWRGDIIAYFKNSEIMKMKNYGVSFVFRKLNNQWKVIHSHESSLPPEIIKNKPT